MRDRLRRGVSELLPSDWLACRLEAKGAGSSGGAGAGEESSTAACAAVDWAVRDWPAAAWIAADWATAGWPAAAEIWVCN